MLLKLILRDSFFLKRKRKFPQSSLSSQFQFWKSLDRVAAKWWEKILSYICVVCFSWLNMPLSPFLGKEKRNKKEKIRWEKMREIAEIKRYDKAYRGNAIQLPFQWDYEQWDWLGEYTCRYFIFALYFQYYNNILTSLLYFMILLLLLLFKFVN